MEFTPWTWREGAVGLSDQSQITKIHAKNSQERNLKGGEKKLKRVQNGFLARFEMATPGG
jgi:hypothetical protein